MNGRTSFKDELRKSLIIYALTPCLLLGFICIAGYIVGTYISVSHVSKKEAIKNSNEFKGIIQEYTKYSEDMANRLNVNSFLSDNKYKVDYLAEMYDFLNTAKTRGDFYIFDKDADNIYTTQSNLSMTKLIANQIRGNISKIIKGQSNIYIYDSHDLSLGPVSAFMIFRPVFVQGELDSICGFVVNINSFGYADSMDASTILLTNQYNRVLNLKLRIYADERGKILDCFKNHKGLVRYLDKWYYSYFINTDVSDIMVYSISDCSTNFYLSISLAMFLILTSVIATIMIRISADRFSRKKTDIIYKLKSALLEVEEGNLDTVLEIESNDEFQYIGHSFNMMIESIKDLINKHELLAKENTTANLQMMESQFNPHFLFNTLESIKYMIKFDPDTAQKILVDLSRLLRYSLANSADTVELKQELEFVRRYMDIMKVRFGSRLEFELNYDLQLNSLEVPRMIIQPIIENSIKYGFNENNNKLKVSLNVNVDISNTYIIVRDDGKGIDENLLDELKANLLTRQNRTQHIGLYNVNQRIVLLYGKEYGVNIESNAKNGTSVYLKLPKLRKANSDV